MPTLEDIAKGLEAIRTKIPGIQAGLTELGKAKEGEIRTIGGKRKIYRPWGEWEEVTPGEEAWQKAGGIAPPEWEPIVTGGIAPSEWKPIVTTEKTTPTTPTELYDIGKIQSDLTTASTSKKAAYDELIGLQSGQYETEYNKAGLGDLKTKVTGIDSDITDEKRVRDESIDKVRRNPYYSAATITGEVAEIERTSNARLNRLIDQRNSIAGQFNTGIDDITRKVGYATSDAQTKYSYWESEEKRLSGLVSTYQTELRRQLERKEAAPSVFGTAETGYRQWDPATKTWKMIIPPTPKERVEKFRSIKDPITGKAIGYFNPTTGESHYYSPGELGVPGAPGVSEVGTYTENQMREYIRDKIRRWGVSKGTESKIQDVIDKDPTISADQKERMKAILLKELEIARGLGFWGRFVSPEW